MGKHIKTGVDAQESNGCTALHIATLLSSSEDDYPRQIIEMLIKNGADPSVKTDGGDSSL